MKRFIAFLTALLLLTAAFPFAANAYDVYDSAKFTFKNEDTTLPYRLILPESYSEGKEYPMIVFFHGAGERGNDNELQFVHCVQYLYDNAPEDCIILAPQCPTGNQWVDTPWANGNYSIDQVKESNELGAVVELISEIEKDAADEIAIKTEKLEKAKQAIKDKEAQNKKPTKGELKALETSQKTLDKLLADKEVKVNALKEKAEKQRQAIADVETELLQMFANPELRKRYFAIVDMDDIEENEFNLNIPRYVDTFEPEEQIDLQEAIRDFQKAIQTESETMQSLNELLKTLTDNK